MTPGNGHGGCRDVNPDDAPERGPGGRVTPGNGHGGCRDVNPDDAPERGPGGRVTSGNGHDGCKDVNPDDAPERGPGGRVTPGNGHDGCKDVNPDDAPERGPGAKVTSGNGHDGCRSVATGADDSADGGSRPQCQPSIAISSTPQASSRQRVPASLSGKFWERALSCSFVITFLMLGTAGFAAYRDAAALVASHEWFKNNLTSTLSTEAVLCCIADIRLEHYKFCLTGNTRFLEAAEAIVAAVRERLREDMLSGFPPGSASRAEMERFIATIVSPAEDRHNTALRMVAAGEIDKARSWLQEELLTTTEDNACKQLAQFRTKQAIQVRSRAMEFERQVRRTGSFAFLIAGLLGALLLLGVAQRYVQARRQAEQALLDSERRIRAVVDHMFDGLLAVDSQARILAANQRAEQIFGCQRGELAGSSLITWLPQEFVKEERVFASEIAAGVHDRLEQGYGRTIEGREFPVELAFSVVPGLGEIERLVTVRDVTQRLSDKRWKQGLVSTISENLRSPLTVVRGSLGLLTAGALGSLPGKARDALIIAERNTIRLVNLMNDLLDMENLEAGALKLSLRSCSARHCVERSIDAVRAMADQRGVRLVSDIADAYFLADDERIVQVLVNLISNAVKFSPSGSTTTVSCQPCGDGVHFAVKDQGRGIPEEKLQDIFERFKQAEGADARQGTGLGLPICKMLIESHNGKIGASSTPGQGTTMWFEIPAAG